MVIVKKLFFAIPFLLAFIAFCINLNPFLQNPNLLLSFDFQVIAKMITLLILLLLAATFFAVFTALAVDWKLVLPVALLTSLTALLFLSTSTAIILAAGFLLAFGVIYFLLAKKLAGYLTFQATTLLVPSIKQTVTFVILISSLAFYLASNNEIQTNGFKLPEGLLNLPLQMTQTMQLPDIESDIDTTVPVNPGGISIPPEQIEALKQNPDLLKQFGLDASMLDQLEKPQNNPVSKAKSSINTQDLIKPMIEKQVERFIKPYVQYIPIFLAASFFLTLHSLASIIAVFLPIFVWLIFWILEKTGFVKFEIETREVKKLVV